MIINLFILIVCLLSVAYCLSGCTTYKNETFTKIISVPYQEYKTITYSCLDNPSGKCTREVYNGTKFTNKEETFSKISLVCCENYLLETATNSCNPVCNNTCENGYCSNPNECGCNLGYKKSKLTEKCVPIVPICKTCKFGECISPQKCKCSVGYVNSDASTCIPHCTKPCLNGQCTGPDICKCNDGYTLSNNSDECIRVVDCKCENGFCPEECGFDYDYIESISDLPTLCHHCENAECTSSGKCECWAGYIPDGLSEVSCRPSDNETDEIESSTFIPVCECTNGFCVEPSICKCNEKHQKLNDSSNTCYLLCGSDVNCLDKVLCTGNKCLCRFHEQRSMYCILDNINTSTNVLSSKRHILILLPIIFLVAIIGAILLFLSYIFYLRKHSNSYKTNTADIFYQCKREDINEEEANCLTNRLIQTEIEI